MLLITEHLILWSFFYYYVLYVSELQEYTFFTKFEHSHQYCMSY